MTVDMRIRQKMKCPRCGADMNHHADKVLPSESTEASSDNVFGGTLMELHSCPACGSGGTRNVQSLDDEVNG